MKAAAVFALLIAITAGLWGCLDLVNNMNNRDKHVRLLSTGSSGFYYDLSVVDNDEAQERQDGFLLLFAFSALSASMALFAQAKHNASRAATVVAA
jgi:hypothetical protein